jgi:hypothetical protein
MGDPRLGSNGSKDYYVVQTVETHLGSTQSYVYSAGSEVSFPGVKATGA